MPPDSITIAVADSCYDILKKDVLAITEKTVALLRQSRSVDIDDKIGTLGENTCSASGNSLDSFLRE